MALRFYRVEGAGGCGAAVNGWYERQGTSNDKPKYHQIGGTGIIYYYSNDRWTEFNDRWKLNDEDDEDGWYYSRAESSDTPPEGQWTTEGFGGSGADPPPTLTAHSSMDHGDALASGLGSGLFFPPGVQGFGFKQDWSDRTCTLTRWHISFFAISWVVTRYCACK